MAGSSFSWRSLIAVLILCLPAGVIYGEFRAADDPTAVWTVVSKQHIGIGASESSFVETSTTYTNYPSLRK